MSVSDEQPRRRRDNWDVTVLPWPGCVDVGRSGKSGCDGCYAEEFDGRLLHNNVTHFGGHAPRLMLSDAHRGKPLTWNRRAALNGCDELVFCGSMCDVMERRDDLDAPRQRLF